jgi:hypothetical protein
MFGDQWEIVIELEIRFQVRDAEMPWNFVFMRWGD